MAKLSPKFWLDVETVLDEKLVELQARAFTELAELPEATDHGYVHIGEKDVSLTLFAWHRSPGSVIVVVQAAVKGWLGSWRSFEKGFVAFEDGTTRPTTQEELESGS